jgi:hypothetical protein
MEALSLAFWTGLAAWLVGMRGRPLLLAVLAGLVVTSVAITLQVALQPGQERGDGTAAGATHITGNRALTPGFVPAAESD